MKRVSDAHQAYKPMHDDSFRKQEREKRAERILEEIMRGNSPNLMIKISTCPRK